MRKRILITGGFGYLGGRIAVELAKNPNYIVRLGTRKHQKSPTWLPDAEIAEMNFSDSLSLKKALHDVNWVVHLAAMNAEACLAKPDDAISVNVDGTHALLQAAIDTGVKRFIYMSTAHVYGHLVGHITEKTATVSTHPYATSHRAAEDVVRCAHEHEKIEGIVVRLSNAYGMPVHKDTDCWMLLINDLCRQALTTRKIVLNSSGLQRRDFVPIAEVCRVVVHLFNMAKKEIEFGLFNLGGSWSPTVWEVAVLIQERCKKIFGFCPLLTRASVLKDGQTIPVLKYGVERLYKTGLQQITDKTKEIDRLLQFCDEQFMLHVYE
jgi:UDP-glucose 4-epimerase